VPLQKERNATDLDIKTTGLPKDFYSTVARFFYCFDVHDQEVRRTPVGIMSKNTLAQNQLTLLVVAPNKEMLNLVNAILSIDDNRVLLADHEETGFTLAMAEQPDVILATSGSHEIGSALCQQVRQEPLTAKIPFVMLTTSSNRKTYAAYFANGCDQILPVPFKCVDIYTAIKNARKRNQENNQSKIHALFKSGVADFIDPHVLNQSLAAEEILCFHRKNGLVLVGRSPIRCTGHANYAGPERRQRAI